MTPTDRPGPGGAAGEQADRLDARRLAAVGSDAGGEVGTQAADRTMWGAWQGRVARPATLLGQVHRGHGSRQAARVGLRADFPGDAKPHQQIVQSPLVERTCRGPVGLLGCNAPKRYHGMAVGRGRIDRHVGRAGLRPDGGSCAAWDGSGAVFRGRGRQRQAGARSSIEFYHRFEQIAARLGLQRAAGQTPREFARAAGVGWPRSAGGANSMRGPCRWPRRFTGSVSAGGCWTLRQPGASSRRLDELMAGSDPPPAK